MELRPFCRRSIALTAAILFYSLLPVACLAAEPAGELSQRLGTIKFDHYAEAPGYSEGPTWRNGDVFFCSGALLRVSADQKTETYLDLNPAGTVLRGDGHLLICDNKYKAIIDLAPNGTADVIADQFESKPLRSLNDLTLDANGNIYWSDPEGSSAQSPIGNVFRCRTDGRVDRIATGLAFPNGLDVDPASKFLYVIESQSKKILRYALPDDHDVCGEPEVFYDLQGSGGDGCAFDVSGNLWVADFHRPETGHGRITVLSPKAEVLAYLPLPAKVVSNITFGGPNHDEIFCTTGDPPGVFHAKVGIKGFAGHPGRKIPAIRPLNLVVRRPHVDTLSLQKIAKVALEASINDGALNTIKRQQVVELIAGLSDHQVRSDAETLLPVLEQAISRAAADRALVAEVKRLNGRALFEVVAPEWLRAIAGDESLTVFARIVELNLNERTDGHQAPDAKPLTDRVHDETLRLLVGQDALRRLELSGTAVTSAGLVHLKDLTTLQYLNICLTGVSDEGFEHLSNLTRMRRMTVCSSKITGTGFAHLTSMRQLESINLHSSPATDAGLEAISKLLSLQRLEIVHTNVTDAGLKYLAALTKLRRLHIHGREATEAGLPFLSQLTDLFELDVYDRAASNQTLSQIQQLPKLRMLRLFNGSFDDAGVKHLATVQTLEELTLNSDKVTDAAIDDLGRLKSLRTINLGGTRITEAGLRKLKASLPTVRITK